MEILQWPLKPQLQPEQGLKFSPSLTKAVFFSSEKGCRFKLKPGKGCSVQLFTEEAVFFESAQMLGGRVGNPTTKSQKL